MAERRWHKQKRKEHDKLMKDKEKHIAKAIFYVHRGARLPEL